MNNRFEFTKSQRKSLGRALEGKRCTEKKRTAIPDFLAYAEVVIASHIAADSLRCSSLSTKDRRALFDSLGAHAKALSQALRELPSRERQEVDAIASIYLRPDVDHDSRINQLASVWVPNGIPPRQSPDATGALKGLENSCLALFNASQFLRPAPPKSGDQKDVERSILCDLVTRHQIKLGAVSASETGTFFAFLKELGPMVNREFGAGILKRVLKFCPNLKG